MWIPIISLCLMGPDFVHLENRSFILEDVEPSSHHSFSVGYQTPANETVRVRSIVETCTCTVSVNNAVLSTVDFLLQPGDSDYLVIDYTAPSSGVFDDYIHVKFVGMESGKEQVTRITIQGRVKKTSLWSNPLLPFQNINVAQKQTIKLSSLTGNDLALKIRKVNPDLLDVSADGSSGISVSLNERALLTADRSIKGWIEYSYPYGEIDVVDRLPFEIALSNPCSVQPRLVLFGRVESELDLIQKAVIDCEGLEIVRVVDVPDYLSIRYEKIQGQYVMLMKLTKEPSKRFSDDIYLEVKDAPLPLRLQVAGQILVWPKENEGEL